MKSVINRMVIVVFCVVLSIFLMASHVVSHVREPSDSKISTLIDNSDSNGENGVKVVANDTEDVRATTKNSSLDGDDNEYQTAIAKFKKNGLNKGIVAFGSARIPSNDEHLKEIEEISDLCAKRIAEKKKNISFITGGGPSVMESWLKSAYKHGVQTGGFAIKLPYEEKQNEYVNSNFAYDFRTFASRKRAMIDYAMAFVVFKGGFGTMDELFEVLNLMNTRHIKRVPILVYPSDFYKNVLNFDTFVADGTIKEDEMKNIKICSSKEELVNELYKIIDSAM